MFPLWARCSGREIGHHPDWSLTLSGKRVGPRGCVRELPEAKTTPTWDDGVVDDTSSTSGPPPPSTAPDWSRVPRLDKEHSVIGGVAAGIARDLGVDSVWVRLVFVALFLVGGWGAVLYLLLWLIFVVAESRSGSSSHQPLAETLTLNARRFIGIALIVLGLWIETLPTLLPESVSSPIGLMAAAWVLLYRQSEGGGRNNSEFWTGSLPLVAAAVLAGVAAGRLVASLGQGPMAYVLVVILLLALLASAPWWWRIVNDLDAERRARARADERAEVAAHLHDSVLQTLILIQKTDDAGTARQLARRQERELRNWLDPVRIDREGMSLRGQLDLLASDVEELHGVPVEVVAVGDCLVDETIEAALGATREAAVNAARHSGTERIDVYSEVRFTDMEQPGRLEIFVRDSGRGFDPAAVPAGHRGVRYSIHDRMQRCGGKSVIDSSPGRGTEVELSLPVKWPADDLTREEA